MKKEKVSVEVQKKGLLHSRVSCPETASCNGQDREPCEVLSQGSHAVSSEATVLKEDWQGSQERLNTAIPAIISDRILLCRPSWLFVSNRLIHFMYMVFCLSVCACLVLKERASNPLEMVLKVLVSAGNPTWVFRKSNQCSELSPTPSAVSF